MTLTAIRQEKALTGKARPCWAKAYPATDGRPSPDRRKWIQDRARGLDRATRDADQVDGDQDTDEPQT
jgi:hypothetical protein